MILRNPHQDLSNEGPNFIFNLLEMGHWAAQTWPFFWQITDSAILDKGKILNFLRFYLGHTVVSIDSNISFDVARKLFSWRFTKIDWVDVMWNV